MPQIIHTEFQRIYTPSAFREERILWRSVIQLNLVRSIRIIMDAIQDIRRYELLPPDHDGDEYDEFAYERVGPPPHLEALCMRLLPLRHIETLLIAKLVPPNEDEATRLGVSNPPRHLGYSSSQTLVNSDYSRDREVVEDDRQPFSYRHQPEIFVRPTNTSWKGSLKRYGRPSSLGNTGQETQDESQIVINECRQAMIALWDDKLVRQVLRKRKIRLEESPGL